MSISRRIALTTAAAGGLALIAGVASAEERERRERHPAIRAAINALQKAKADLQHADHDFGGHRAEALESIDRAMNQLRLALQSDRR
jgi:hypothetical protein